MSRFQLEYHSGVSGWPLANLAVLGEPQQIMIMMQTTCNIHYLTLKVLKRERKGAAGKEDGSGWNGWSNVGLVEGRDETNQENFN